MKVVQVSCVLLLVAVASASGQQLMTKNWVSTDTARAADMAAAQQRAELAEQIVAQREAPGRQLDASYRASLVSRLQTQSIEKLQSISTGLMPVADALGDSSADLVYVPFATPCRALDTRLTAAGAIAAGSTRSFYVSGIIGSSQGGATNCNVPYGPATAVNVNFAAVAPAGTGNLRGSAYPNAVPATGSIINYQTATPAVANAVVFPICDTTVSNCAAADITVLANAAATQLVVDVLGYFERFPKEQVRSFTVAVNTGTTVSLPVSTCVNVATISVVAPVAGTVVVRALAGVQIFHVNGAVDWGVLNLATNASTCDAAETQLGFSDYVWITDGEPNSTNAQYPKAHLLGSFPVSAGTNTFYLNAYKLMGGTMNFWDAGLTAEFQPN